jgi:hypothetical protein
MSKNPINTTITLPNIRRVRRFAKSDYQLRHVFMLSVLPSARGNSAPTRRIFMKLDIWVFLEKSAEKTAVSSKSEKNNGYFTWRPIYVHLWRYLAEFFLQCAMFQTKVVEKIKARFYVKKLFPKILPFVRWCGKIRYRQTGHRQYTTAQARCVLVTTTDKHTHSEYVTRIPFPWQQW